MAESRRQPRHKMAPPEDDPIQKKRDILFVFAFIGIGLTVISAMFALAEFLARADDGGVTAAIIFGVLAVVTGVLLAAHWWLGRKQARS